MEEGTWNVIVRHIGTRNRKADGATHEAVQALGSRDSAKYPGSHLYIIRFHSINRDGQRFATFANLYEACALHL